MKQARLKLEKTLAGKSSISWMDNPKKEEDEKKARRHHHLSHHAAPPAEMAAPGGVTKTTGTVRSAHRTTYATPPKRTHRKEVDQWTKS